jgi:LysM repeat protein
VVEHRSDVRIEQQFEKATVPARQEATMSNTTATRVYDPAQEAKARRRAHLSVVPDVPSAHGRPSARPRTAVAGEPPLRLTPRGRLVLRALVVVALAALITTTALVLARSARADADSHAPVRYHVVMPGETLWGIATQLSPGTDPRDTVALLVEVNHLPSSGVLAGQRLVIPEGLPTPR